MKPSKSKAREYNACQRARSRDIAIDSKDKILVLETDHVPSAAKILINDFGYKVKKIIRGAYDKQGDWWHEDVIKSSTAGVVYVCFGRYKEQIKIISRKVEG